MWLWGSFVLFLVLVVVVFPLIPVVIGNVVKATVSVLQDYKKKILNRQGLGFLFLIFFLGGGRGEGLLSHYICVTLTSEY